MSPSPSATNFEADRNAHPGVDPEADRFDYIVVGAGSAGCVLAHRLTEDPDVSVLLLEAGPADTLDAIRVPVLTTSLFGSDIDWNHSIDEQANYQGSLLFPRGKTLGGSSSINLMMYVRGSRADFDRWSALGNTGWDFDSVLPYFIKAERNSRLAGPLHGTAGPLHVEDRLFTHELSEAWIDAAAAWGLARTDDFNGESQLGAGSYQVTCHNGVRWSSADAYLRPALDRPNLVVRVDAHVTRVVVEGGRATGVEYLRDGVPQTAAATTEVILSGGAINSPQLLLLSGIGSARRSRDLGVDVVADVPGVGENLHDHTMAPLVWGTAHSTDLLELATAENMALWQSGRGGPFASNIGEVGAFHCTDGSGRPNIQLVGGPTSMVGHGRADLTPPNFNVFAASVQPRSRGRLWLRSANPRDHPHIDPAYYADPRDLDDVVTGLRLALEIAERDPIAKYLRQLSLPATREPTDAQLAEHARMWSQSVYHAVGTCAMGTGPGAVVDPELRVHGVTALRVVDASVMPVIPSGNINAATVMIAEKAADLIAADA